MSDTEKRRKADNPSPGEGEAIERLLRLAGPRPSVPKAAENRVRAATREAWRGELTGRRRRRYLWGGAGLAAAATLIFALLPFTPEDPAVDVAAPVQVATLDTATGEVSRTPVGTTSPLGWRTGEPLFVGDRIATGPGARLALTLTDGASLRLDHRTSVSVLAPRELELERGGLYFDSAGARADSPPLAIRTDVGTVRDIGTQFEVRREPARPEAHFRVRVREGLVTYDNNGTQHDAGAGFELRVDEAGVVSRHATPLFGPSWEWVLDVAPAFELEGHTLESFLAWVSRETGWRTEFTDAATAESADTVVLHGSIAGLRPDRALEAVLPTCGLEHRFDNGTLVIEAQAR